MYVLNVNGNDFEVEAQPDELLVWVIHEKIGLSKTRFGCGIEFCGSCFVLIDGQPVRSCKTPVGTVIGKKITTREALPENYSFSE